MMIEEKKELKLTEKEERVKALRERGRIMVESCM